MNKTLVLPTVIATVIGIAGVLLLLFAWHLPPFSPAVPTTENAYIRGKVTSIAPQLSGYLSEVDVVDFQEVKAGDVIARIDDRIFRQKLAQASAMLASAKATHLVTEQNVRSAEAAARAGEASLGAAQSALDSARLVSGRAEALKARGVSTQTATEQANLALQQAQSKVVQAEAELDVQRESINSALAQVTAAQSTIANAEAAVALAQIDLANTEIHAPTDGRLGQVAARIGQYVTAGTALVAHVGKDVWVIANFSETNLHGMQLGQTVLFTVDALDGQTFIGKVASFSPATASEFSLLAGTNATGNFTKIVQRVPVRIAIEPDQPMSNYLAPGLSVIVEVETR